MRWVVSGLVLFGLAGVSSASSVRTMSPAELTRGADTIVDGEVLAVTTRWNAQQTGLETEVLVSVHVTRKGAPGDTITIVQPGGTLDGDHHLIVGMPVHRRGDQVRLFLRALPAANSYRVFGWHQGQWRAYVADDGALSYAPAEHIPPTALEYTHNGMVWPASRIPVRWLLNRQPSDDVTFDQGKAAIQAAFATWSDVPCSSLSFEYAGETDLGVAVDDTNVILWIEADWIYGEEAAGATSLWIPMGEIPTADVALNGQHFQWAIGATTGAPMVQDVQGVMTHELGHFNGLSHTERALDTMYYSWTPWQGQRSLSADDKLGLCALYPQDGDECATDDDCAEQETCEPYAMGTLCTPYPDPMGAQCSTSRVECSDFCLYTQLDLSDGYCSKFCDGPSDCPTRFVCQDASAGGDIVKVCFKDPAFSCAETADCPAGYFCPADGFCNRQCVEDFDCNDKGLVCDDHGQCVAEDSGGICRVGHSRRGDGTTSLGIILLALVLAMRRRGHPG